MLLPRLHMIDYPIRPFPNIVSAFSSNRNCPFLQGLLLFCTYFYLRVQGSDGLLLNFDIWEYLGFLWEVRP